MVLFIYSFSCVYFFYWHSLNACLKKPDGIRIKNNDQDLCVSTHAHFMVFKWVA